MSKTELKNYITEQIKDLEKNGRKWIEETDDDQDYREGRIEGLIYAYGEMFDMIKLIDNLE